MREEVMRPRKGEEGRGGRLEEEEGRMRKGPKKRTDQKKRRNERGKEK